MNRDLPESAFAVARAVDGPTRPATSEEKAAFSLGQSFGARESKLPSLAARALERIAILERVRPVLSDAIHAARTADEVMFVTLLGVRIMTAICKETP